MFTRKVQATVQEPRGRPADSVYLRQDAPIELLQHFRGRWLVLSELSDKDYKVLKKHWDKVGFPPQCDLRNWRPIAHPEANRVLQRELSARLDDRRKAREAAAAEKARQERVNQPGFYVETKERDILYRGHVVEDRREATLARAWIAMQRRHPELAAALQRTPFPSGLSDLVRQYHTFTGIDGVPIRAVILENGRAFFTSTNGGREPPVIRPKPQAPTPDRVEARPRAEPALARPSQAAQEGTTRLLIPLLRALDLPANADRATIEATYLEVRMSPSPSAAKARDAYAAWIEAQESA